MNAPTSLALLVDGAPPVEFTLDGQTVRARPDETLWQVAKRAGIAIPHLCHKEGLEPAGNCRACMVEIDGERVLAASCCRAPCAGMSVRSDSSRAVAARTMVIELLVSDAGAASNRHTRASELTRWADRLGVESGRLPQRDAHYAAPDTSHAAIAVNLDA